MFTGIILACNMLTNDCVAQAVPTVFGDKDMCNMVTEALREEVMSELPKYVIVMFKCVEFPSPA
jgi:hypothetical protein